jgi:hypothetical protein
VTGGTIRLLFFFFFLSFSFFGFEPEFVNDAAGMTCHGYSTCGMYDNRKLKKKPRVQSDLMHME